MTATLTLYVNGTERARETRTLIAPHFLREVKAAQEALLTKVGAKDVRTLVAVDTVPGIHKRFVSLTTGPVTAYVTFDA